MTNSTSLHIEIALLEEMIFQPCGAVMSEVKEEPESQEYCAHEFQLEKKKVKFRKAKITPTKTGQFVTLWKRNKTGVTEPFNISDTYELYIVATKENHHIGFFVFPKAVLYTHGILSDDRKEGKRGVRVYPPWNLTTNKQAQKTQQWQLNYFIELSGEKHPDLEKVKTLLR